MKTQSSRIVIVDQVLPDSKVTAFSAMMDLTMMNFGGMERTERQWRKLLEGVGMRIIRIEPSEEGSLSLDGIIEAVLEICSDGIAI